LNFLIQSKFGAKIQNFCETENWGAIINKRRRTMVRLLDVNPNSYSGLAVHPFVELLGDVGGHVVGVGVGTETGIVT